MSWDPAGERLIGDAAKNQATVNPEQTVFDVKRLIGRKYSDKTVQADKKVRAMHAFVFTWCPPRLA